MSLKKSAGNMYPWVTHTHSHLRGGCPHRCGYCYVQAMERKFSGGHYTGPLRLEEKEFKVNYGVDRTIFIEHCNDLFADDIPGDWIRRILAHCAEWHQNNYVLQTKNVGRLVQLLANRAVRWPLKFMVGTTIESNRWHDVMGKAPTPQLRIGNFKRLRSYWPQVPAFITIEPVLDFDDSELIEWIAMARPDFINIGADSKGHGLQEPDAAKIMRLINGVTAAGIPIRQKHNLDRLLKS